MPRYINEDDFCEYIRKNTTPSGAEWFISKIKDMPSADVVEVVRCKDCKYWEYKCQGDFDFAYGDCLFWQIEFSSDYYMGTTGNHYCGFAKERKETDA